MIQYIRTSWSALCKSLSYLGVGGVELHTFGDLLEDDIQSGKMIHYHKVKKTKWVVMAACTELNEL